MYYLILMEQMIDCPLLLICQPQSQLWLFNSVYLVGNIMSMGFEKAFVLQTDLNLPTLEILASYVYKMGLEMGDYSFSTTVVLFYSYINIIDFIATGTVSLSLRVFETALVKNLMNQQYLELLLF